MYTEIEVKKDNGIYSIIFNRPDVLNAVNNKMSIEIIDVLNEIKKNDDCRTLILTGTEKSFTVGADTKAVMELSKVDYDAYVKRFFEMLTIIESFPSPVIGMINGFAFGGGAEVACVCDIRIGSKDASFRFPGVSYGLVVSASTLSTIVGIARAKELMFSSGIIDAEEAYRIGLLNQSIEAEELEAFTYEYAEKIVKNPRVPVEKAKEVLNQMPGKDKPTRRNIENLANDYIRKNTDQRKTFSHFSDKRKVDRDW